MKNGWLAWVTLLSTRKVTTNTPFVAQLPPYSTCAMLPGVPSAVVSVPNRTEQCVRGDYCREQSPSVIAVDSGAAEKGPRER